MVVTAGWNNSLFLSKYWTNTSASVVNIQVYLLDGLTMWNAMHASAAVRSFTAFPIVNFDLWL